MPATDRARARGDSARALFVAFFVFLYVPFAYHFGWKFLPGGNEDYPSYHYAAVLAFAEGKSPYGAAAFHDASVVMERQLHAYIYPPPSLLAFWPLSKLAFSLGKAALLVASHLGYLWAIWLILAKLTPLSHERWQRDLLVVISLVFFFTFDPAITTLAIGQINLVALPFVCLALVGMRKESATWQIALPLSMAILLKTYPVLLLVPLLFHRRFKALLLTCGLFAGYTALALLVLPTEVWSTWFQDVMPQGGYANKAMPAAGPWNQNINAFVTRLFLPNEFSDAPLAFFAPLAKPSATLLALFVAGVTCFYGLRQSRRAPSGQISLEEIATYLLMMFLIAPLSWDHHLVFVLPAIVLGIHLLFARALSRIESITVLAAIFVMAWPIPFHDPALRHGWLTLLISVKFYAAGALWLFWIVRLRSGTSGSAEEARSLTR